MGRAEIVEDGMVVCERSDHLPTVGYEPWEACKYPGKSAGSPEELVEGWTNARPLVARAGRLELVGWGHPATPYSHQFSLIHRHPTEYSAYPYACRCHSASTVADGDASCAHVVSYDTTGHKNDYWEKGTRPSIG